MNGVFTQSDEVMDLVFSATYEYEIPSLRLGMTVATQSGIARDLILSARPEVEIPRFHQASQTLGTPIRIPAILNFRFSQL